MSAFGKALAERQPDPAGRRWLFVPYDRLSDRIGPLSREEPAAIGIVLVESRGKAARRPYHRQELALVLANLRHFALEQAARGVAVRHLSADGPYREALGRTGERRPPGSAAAAPCRRPSGAPGRGWPAWTVSWPTCGPRAGATTSRGSWFSPSWPRSWTARPAS